MNTKTAMEAVSPVFETSGYKEDKTSQRWDPHDVVFVTFAQNCYP